MFRVVFLDFHQLLAGEGCCIPPSCMAYGSGLGIATDVDFSVHLDRGNLKPDSGPLRPIDSFPGVFTATMLHVMGPRLWCQPASFASAC